MILRRSFCSHALIRAINPSCAYRISCQNGKVAHGSCDKFYRYQIVPYAELHGVTVKYMKIRSQQQKVVALLVQFFSITIFLWRNPSTFFIFLKSNRNFQSCFEAPVICCLSGLCLFSSQAKTLATFFLCFCFISMFFRSVFCSICYGLVVSSSIPVSLFVKAARDVFCRSLPFGRVTDNPREVFILLRYVFFQCQTVPVIQVILQS